MGTSASSKGPAGGVPMVPPWVPDPVPPNPPPDAPPGPAGDGSNDNQQGPDYAAPQQAPLSRPPTPRLSPIAPAARFNGARRSLGDFARSGDSDDMRRGLRHYVRSGYGGGA